jgi:ankyrin repeat protein
MTERTVNTLVQHAREGDAAALSEALHQRLPAGAVDAWDDREETALTAAVRAGHADAVDALIAAGADTEMAAGEAIDATPLMLAARFGRPRIVQQLLDGGASLVGYPVVATHDPDGDGYGTTPLGIAVLHGHRETAAVLLKNGAMPARDVQEFGVPGDATLQ